MTEQDCTSLKPIEVVDSNGEVVWCGFGRVTSCSIPRALESETGRFERTVKENIEARGVQANETKGDTSGKPDMPVTEASTTKRKFKRQRVEDPFMCASIGHLTAFPMTKREMTALLVMAGNSDTRGKVHISQENIAEKMKISRPRVTALVASLIEKGYIRRTMRKGFNTPDFGFHPEAIWFDKLIYRNSEIERIRKAKLMKSMKDMRDAA